MFRWSNCGIQALLRVMPDSSGDLPHHLALMSSQTRFQRETREAMGDLMVSPGVWSDPSFAGSVKGSDIDCRVPFQLSDISRPVGIYHFSKAALHVERPGRGAI